METCNHSYDPQLFITCPVCEPEQHDPTYYKNLYNIVQRIASMSDTELLCRTKIVSTMWNNIHDKMWSNEISWLEYAELLHIEIQARIAFNGEI